MAELKAYPRWPCFWGEEYTSNLAEGRGDGGYGYRTCGLRRLRSGPASAKGQAPACIVYSFGCDGDFEFERAIAIHHGDACEIHIFDLDFPGPHFDQAFADVHVSAHFHQMPISDRDGMQTMQMWPHATPVKIWTWTLPTIMATLGHTHIDILKLDIEGNEHRVIAHLAEQGWPSMPGQVYMEIHASPQFQPYQAQHARRLISTLERGGLRLMHAESPWHWCQDSCLQLSFIHRDWAPGIGHYPGMAGWLDGQYDCDHNSQEFIYEIHKNGSGLLAQPVRMLVEPRTSRKPVMVAGAHFTVYWVAKNVGKVPLLAGCCGFVSVDGEDWRIKTPAFDDGLAADIRPGDSVVFRMDLEAPPLLGRRPGPRTTWWRMQTKAGMAFGSAVRFAVQVVEKPG